MLRIALTLLLAGFAGDVALAANEANPPAPDGAPAAQAPAPSEKAAASGGSPL